MLVLFAPWSIFIGLTFWNALREARRTCEPTDGPGRACRFLLLWFGVVQQAVQVVPVFYAAFGVTLAVRMLAGDMFPGWSAFVAPALEALIWPLVSVLLLAPQRRAPDPDQNRPL